jgi:hypothetical protein
MPAECLYLESITLESENLMSENDNTYGKIIAKAWRDPAFKSALIANPAAALKAEGIDVPAGMAVTVLENTDNQFHLVLPPVPTDELSDEALDAVAGGCSPSPKIIIRLAEG